MSKLPVSVGLRTIDKPAAHALPSLDPLAPLESAMKTHTLVQRQLSRMLHNSLMSAGLATRIGDPRVWSEWLQLQAAVAERLNQQGRDWAKGCAILANDYGQLRHANTMSKLMEKQGNLVSQWMLLVSTQATQLVTLLENVHVDYEYWASLKLQGN